MKIEKNIPIHPIHITKDSPTDTLRAMVSGDSVAVDPARFKVWRSCAKQLRVKIISRAITPTSGRIWLA